MVEVVARAAEAVTSPRRRFKKMFMKMLSSWLRAIVAIVGPTQGLNAFDARGLFGLSVAMLMTLIGPLLVFLTGAADLLDEE